MFGVNTTCFQYKRRQPEITPCYKVVQEHLATFVHERELENRPLPPYVLKEFDAYLKYGILAHGFLRLKCCSSSQEKIVGFSCKKRDFCPSCAGKRMTQVSGSSGGECLTSCALPTIYPLFSHAIKILVSDE